MHVRRSSDHLLQTALPLPFYSPGLHSSALVLNQIGGDLGWLGRATKQLPGNLDTPKLSLPELYHCHPAFLGDAMGTWDPRILCVRLGACRISGLSSPQGLILSCPELSGPKHCVGVYQCDFLEFCVSLCFD